MRSRDEYLLTARVDKKHQGVTNKNSQLFLPILNESLRKILTNNTPLIRVIISSFQVFSIIGKIFIINDAKALLEIRCDRFSRGFCMAQIQNVETR